MDDEPAISVKTAAKASGFAKNTVGSLAHRGQVPPPPYGPGDVASLLLARRLIDRGMRTAAALEIGFVVKPEWPSIILADSAEEYRRRWLAVWPDPTGVCPFIWDILPADEKLGGLIEAYGERGLILIDASDVVRTVLLSLRSQVPA